MTIPSHRALARSVHQRIGKSGGELDQIGLAIGAGLREHAVQVGFDGRLGDAEDLRRLRHAADLDDLARQRGVRFGAHCGFKLDIAALPKVPNNGNDETDEHFVQAPRRLRQFGSG